MTIAWRRVLSAGLPPNGCTFMHTIKRKGPYHRRALPSLSMHRRKGCGCLLYQNSILLGDLVLLAKGDVDRSMPAARLPMRLPSWMGNAYTNRDGVPDILGWQATSEASAVRTLPIVGLT